MSLQAFLSTPVYTSWDVHCSLQTFLSTPHTSWDVQCLTGRVFKVEPYSFAYGGHSEIWKGTLKHEHSENNLNVHIYFPLMEPSHTADFCSAGGGQGHQGLSGPCDSKSAIMFS